MRIERYKTEAERQKVVARIAKADLSKGFNCEKLRHVLYPIDELGPVPFVPAAAARHMRDEDYVVGVAHNGEAKAFPMYIMDYYHNLNDVLGGDALGYST